MFSQRLAVSDNGWIDNDHCQKWLEEGFISQVTPRNHSGKPILLICDGHGSHCTYKLLVHARNHNIFMLKLVPHTTHKCQPLDVGVLGPLQTAFTKGVDQFVSDHGRGISKKEFIEIYLKARSEAMVPSLITSAFRHCGICPLNPDIFTAEDFSPSQGYSTVARSHLPSTFPQLTDPDSEDIDQRSEGAASYDSGFCDPGDEASEAGNHGEPLEHADTQIGNHSTPRIEGALQKRSPSPEVVILKSYDLKDDLHSRCLALEKKIKVQDTELAQARKEAEDARTHATVLGRQYTAVMNLRNSKKKSHASGTFDAQARVMNTDEALLILQKEDADRIAEEARVEALATGHQQRLELQILNAPRLPWFQAAADVVIQRGKAVVAVEKEAVKAAAKAVRDAKAAALKEVTTTRKLEEKRVRDAEKANKLASDREAKALAKAVKALEKAEIDARKKQEKAGEIARTKELKKAETLRLKQAKSKALRERSAKAVEMETETETPTLEKGGGKHLNPEPTGGAQKKRKVSEATIDEDKENAHRMTDNSPCTLRVSPGGTEACRALPKPKI
jgi:hypothetical protein